MPINSDKPHLWKADVAQSIEYYKRRPRSLEPGAPQYVQLKRWLVRHGYKQAGYPETGNFETIPSGTFAFFPTRTAIKKQRSINAPVDCVAKPFSADKPIIIKVKTSESMATSIRSAKRDARKFAAFKKHQEDAVFMLILSGYFDGYYLGPQAAEGIDWIWQHRLDDLSAYLVSNGGAQNVNT